MYNMINIINTAECYMLKLLWENSESSHHKKKVFYLILYFREMINVH